jgi:hypothetical protein
VPASLPARATQLASPTLSSRVFANFSAQPTLADKLLLLREAPPPALKVHKMLRPVPETQQLTRPLPTLKSVPARHLSMPSPLVPPRQFLPPRLTTSLLALLLARATHPALLTLSNLVSAIFTAQLPPAVNQVLRVLKVLPQVPETQLSTQLLVPPPLSEPTLPH